MFCIRVLVDLNFPILRYMSSVKNSPSASANYCPSSSPVFVRPTETKILNPPLHGHNQTEPNMYQLPWKCSPKPGITVALCQVWTCPQACISILHHIAGIEFFIFYFLSVVVGVDCERGNTRKLEFTTCLWISA